ncbi:MAG: bifunctional phosphoribosylaminoimidazolecarboxamide formyltransferase/IMP cyclohydrolase [Elusimicrobiota bacterium]
MPKTALISVYDKTGIIEFSKGLIKNGFQIISTGGTAKVLKEAGIKVTEVSEITGFPEVFSGRVKTLHPKIFGGILFRSSSEDDRHQAQENKIERMDMVVVNLYPFEEIAAKNPFDAKYLRADIIENIDIGGVALVRAAAKNFEDVVVLCDPSDYTSALEKLYSGKDDVSWRLSLAAKAFRYTAYYDSVIAGYFSHSSAPNFDEKFPVALKKISSLRYGENPHQKASIYAIPLSIGIARSKQIQGKELSYNNYLDTDAAWNAVSELELPACVIVKHTNPCGVAESTDPSASVLDSYKRALSSDPVSAFGGIIALNRKVDKETASEIIKLFTECIIAPGYDEDAKKVFSAKKDLRLLEFAEKIKSGADLRTISGGVLIQEKDTASGLDNLKTVTRNQPEKTLIESLIFACKVAKNVKSNAIVLVRGKQTVGIGAGQMSRIDSIKIAASKMQSVKLTPDMSNKPLVMASDAFFPFRDVVDEAAKIGVKAIIQPGGSLHDDESITACDEHKIAMVFTGVRHFRH